MNYVQQFAKLNAPETTTALEETTKETTEEPTLQTTTKKYYCEFLKTFFSRVTHFQLFYFLLTFRRLGALLKNIIGRNWVIFVIVSRETHNIKENAQETRTFRTMFLSKVSMMIAASANVSRIRIKKNSYIIRLLNWRITEY